MTDETEKLAAQMRNLKPSKTSREAGLEAAMAAFDAEFSATPEKNSISTQGSADAPRPTGKTTKTVRVTSRRVETMSKFNSIFQKPQAMMMAGTCGAALIAALVVLPNMGEIAVDAPLEAAAPVEMSPVEETIGEDLDTQPEGLAVTQSVPAPVLAPELEAQKVMADEVIVATGTRRVEKKEASPTPIGKGGINSVDSLLNDVNRRSATPEQEQVLKNHPEVLQQKDNVELFVAQEAILSTPPPPQLQSAPGFSAPTVNRSHLTINRDGSIVAQTRSRGDRSQPQASQIEKYGDLTLEEVPAEFEIETKEVVTNEATTEYVTIPVEYENITEEIVVQEATTELVTIPPTYNADGSIATPARTAERAIPSKTSTFTRRVVKTPESTVEVTVPVGSKKNVLVATEVSPPKFILRDDDGVIVREFDSRDAFEKYKLNTTKSVAEAPVSTFSVDVDTASYSFLRASINRGQLPPRESIRLEEMINYFPYEYDAPKSAETPFKANVTVTPNPWNADTKLMHIGIKGYVPTQVEKPRSNLVLLIDTSGSMNQANKLPLLINSFKLLLNTLDEDDTVSIVAYASASGTVLEPTPVSEKSDILVALNNLRAGGSTAGAAGIELAYQKAQESFDKDGVNRVILATDGDFNVGFSSPDEMKDFIKEKRETGIFLSVLGFGMGNYNDHLMQSLAQNGNGVAAYIDTLSEANKVLANEAGSALFTIAKDVKIQVEFNPATVAEYRLIGYETRTLKRQDFNNDKVDAGEIGAGHSVTAIYEMTPVGSPAITIDKLRYVSEDETTKNTGSDEFAFVKIRHKLPNADKSTLQTFPIGKRQERSLKRASDDMRFATAVAAVGQKLRGDVQLDNYSYADAIKLANRAKGDDENGYRAEFVQMVKLIEAMEK